MSIELKNVTYTYSPGTSYEIHALKDVSLSIPDGQFIGVIGHTPLTAEPLYTAQTETEKGDPVLRMYEYEIIRGVVYQMDFWLEKRSRFLNCRMRIVNESARVLPMYWWSNIAVPEYEGGRITVPAESAYTNSNGMVYKVPIPMVK